MRGSPLLRALLSFLALLGLGVPLWRLTHQTAAQPAPLQASAPVEASAVRLRLTFSPAPTSVAVRHLGAEVWSESAPAAELERELRVPFPKEGIELQFDIAWPAETLGAMRAQLTDPGGAEIEKTLWGKGDASDVLAFP